MNPKSTLLNEISQVQKGWMTSLLGNHLGDHESSHTQTCPGTQDKLCPLAKPPLCSDTVADVHGPAHISWEYLPPSSGLGLKWASWYRSHMLLQSVELLISTQGSIYAFPPLSGFLRDWIQNPALFLLWGILSFFHAHDACIHSLVCQMLAEPQASSISQAQCRGGTQLCSQGTCASAETRRNTRRQDAYCSVMPDRWAGWQGCLSQPTRCSQSSVSAPDEKWAEPSV